MLTPTQIVRISAEQLQITWPDQAQPSVLSGELLRKHCPCANCRQDDHQAVSFQSPAALGTAKLNIVQQSKTDMCQIKRIWPIGNYALGVEFADDHKTGIFTYTLLRHLS